MILLSFIRRFFKKPNVIRIDTKAQTIPEAFGYPEDKFNILVNELSGLIIPADRLTSFNRYLLSPLFQRLELDLNNPRHAAVIGYAFCAAVMIQRDAQSSQIVNNVLKAFYPESNAVKPNN